MDKLLSSHMQAYRLGQQNHWIMEDASKPLLHRLSHSQVCQPSRHQNCQLATSCLKKLLNPKAIHSKMEVA